MAFDDIARRSLQAISIRKRRLEPALDLQHELKWENAIRHLLKSAPEAREAFEDIERPYESIPDRELTLRIEESVASAKKIKAEIEKLHEKNRKELADHHIAWPPIF